MIDPFINPCNEAVSHTCFLNGRCTSIFLGLLQRNKAPFEGVTGVSKHHICRYLVHSCNGSVDIRPDWR